MRFRIICGLIIVAGLGLGYAVHAWSPSSAPSESGMEPLKGKRQPVAVVKTTEASHPRLLPGTRALNVRILEDAGPRTQIQPGDVVDVEWRATTPDSNGNPVVIARNALVLAKRDAATGRTDTAVGPLLFTLAVNPYRAALIEFARERGEVTLRFVKVLDQATNDVRTVSWSFPGNAEYADEDQRVAEFVSGNYLIDESDLKRVRRTQDVPSSSVTDGISNRQPIAPSDLEDRPLNGRGLFTFAKPVANRAAVRAADAVGTSPSRTGSLDVNRGRVAHPPSSVSSGGAGGIRLTSTNVLDLNAATSYDQAGGFRFRPPESAGRSTEGAQAQRGLVMAPTLPTRRH